MSTNPLPESLTLPWHDPLAYAAGIPQEEPCWMLFYSGLRTAYSGRYSYLVLKERARLNNPDWDALRTMTDEGRSWGYLGYGLKNTVEQLPSDERDAAQSFPSTLPDLWMSQFGLWLVFDHEKQTVEAKAHDATLFEAIPSPSPMPEAQPRVHHITSNMTKVAYLAKVAHLLDAIHAGEIYQANLTRKFSGEIEGTSGLALFARLAARSPAPYSAYLKLDDTHVISSSPEQFLRIDAQGAVEARPIKGTAARSPNDPKADAKAKDALHWSLKDRAENLMIVDLMRNDLSRHCKVGSVQVEDLFAVSSYATVHHMASTIHGQLAKAHTGSALIREAFPPGSMTGAPKIRAMELCTEVETLARGVYSGTIGWMGPGAEADLSVVIRTILLQGGRFEFQVGGAIVADSTPEKEWEETLIKAKAMAESLNLPMQLLREQ